MAHGAHVVEIGEEEFEDVVIRGSRERPVVVDFWAPWCGPCRALGPVLERLADEGQGAWLLVKVNTDENPGISQRLGIRGIPAVKAWKNGAQVSEFTGALPEGEVRRFLGKLVTSDGERLAKEALALVEGGDAVGARARVLEAIAKEPARPLVKLVDAAVTLAEGHVARAAELVERVPPDDEHDALRARLAGQIAVARERGTEGEASLEARLAKNDDDDEARLALAAARAMAHAHEAAFDVLLAVVGGKKGPLRDRAHALAKAIIALAPDEEGRDLRRRLSNVLF